MSTPAEEMRRLLSALLDGKLDEAGRQRLNELVRDDPAAQAKYREVMSLHALLYLDFGQGYQNLLPPLVGKQPPALPDGDGGEFAAAPSTAELAPSQPLATEIGAGVIPMSSGRAAKRRWLAPAALAASVALAAGLMWWMAAGRGSDRGEPENGMLAQGRAAQQSGRRRAADRRDGRPYDGTTARSVAVLGQATGARWSTASSTPNVGGALAAGQFALDEGLIQLEFLSGAVVIIEGPAAFELVSSDRFICRRGKLRAHVPTQAHGFRIDTPGYAAVDLGTEFTVNVAASGQADFHVLDGEVELWDLRSSAETPTETLTTGRGARATATGELSASSQQQPSLIGAQQLQEMSERAQQDRFAKWRSFSAQLRARRDVVLYYGLDGHGEWERELRNDGPNTSELLTGAIVGCQWTTGRWTGKQALEFKRITDRVRVNVPGEFDSLTYATWVRIEGLERWLTALMLTDGHDAHEVHWQIAENGALLLGVNDGEHRLHDYFSPRVLGPTDLGRWVHLAVVYDGAQGVVRHYLDARQLSSEQIVSPGKLRIGRAEIGNWAPHEGSEYRTRSLNGRVDEFILFSSALSGAEILEIYDAGKPHS